MRAEPAGKLSALKRTKAPPCISSTKGKVPVAALGR